MTKALLNSLEGHGRGDPLGPTSLGILARGFEFEKDFQVLDRHTDLADLQIARICVDARPFTYGDLPLSARANRDITLAAVKANGDLMEYVPSPLDGDREVFMAALEAGTQNSGRPLLQFASPALQRDREVCLAALEKTLNSFPHVSPEIEGYRALCLSVFKQAGDLLRDAPLEIRSDFELCQAAVKNYGGAIGAVNPNIVDYKSLCLQAVAENGLNLLVTSPSMQADRDLRLAAATQNPAVLQFIPYDGPSYTDACMAAVKIDGRSLQHVRIEAREDLDLCVAAMKQTIEARPHVPYSLRAEVQQVIDQDSNKD